MLVKNIFESEDLFKRKELNKTTRNRNWWDVTQVWTQSSLEWGLSSDSINRSSSSSSSCSQSLGLFILTNQIGLDLFILHLNQICLHFNFLELMDLSLSLSLIVFDTIDGSLNFSLLHQLNPSAPQYACVAYLRIRLDHELFERWSLRRCVSVVILLFYGHSWALPC